MTGPGRNQPVLCRIPGHHGHDYRDCPTINDGRGWPPEPGREQTTPTPGSDPLRCPGCNSMSQNVGPNGSRTCRSCGLDWQRPRW